MPDYTGLNRAMEMLSRMLGQDMFSRQRLKRQEATSLRLGEASLGRQKQYADYTSGLRIGEREKSAGLTRETDRLRIEKQLKANIARDPLMKQLRAKIFTRRDAGEDTSGLEDQLYNTILDRASLLDQMQKGEPLEQRQLETAASLVENNFLGITREVGLGKRHLESQATTRRGQDITLRGQGVSLRGQELGVGKDYRTHIEVLRKSANAFLDKVLKNPSDYVAADKEGKILDESAEEAFGEGGLPSVSKEDIRYLMTRINRAAATSRRGELSESNMGLLLNVQNLEELVGELSGRPGGEIGDIIGRPETAIEAPEIQPPQEMPLTPEEKRQIYIDRLIQKGMPPEEAEMMAKRKYGF